MSLFHIHYKDCVIIMLITVKSLFYMANAYENGFLNIFSTGNLLNSRALWQSRACAKERKHAIYMSTQTFSTQFTSKYIDFLHFSSVSCQKHIKMNIEWIRMTIPVLISLPVDRYNDKPCTSAEAYITPQLKINKYLYFTLVITAGYKELLIDSQLQYIQKVIVTVGN